MPEYLPMTKPAVYKNVQCVVQAQSVLNRKLAGTEQANVQLGTSHVAILMDVSSQIQPPDPNFQETVVNTLQVYSTQFQTMLSQNSTYFEAPTNYTADPSSATSQVVGSNDSTSAPSIPIIVGSVVGGVIVALFVGLFLLAVKTRNEKSLRPPINQKKNMESVSANAGVGSGSGTAGQGPIAPAFSGEADEDAVSPPMGARPREYDVTRYADDPLGLSLTRTDSSRPSTSRRIGMLRVDGHSAAADSEESDWEKKPESKNSSQGSHKFSNDEARLDSKSLWSDDDVNIMKSEEIRAEATRVVEAKLRQRAAEQEERLRREGSVRRFFRFPSSPRRKEGLVVSQYSNRDFQYTSRNFLSKPLDTSDVDEDSRQASEAVHIMEPPNDNYRPQTPDGGVSAQSSRSKSSRNFRDSHRDVGDMLNDLGHMESKMRLAETPKAANRGNRAQKHATLSALYHQYGV